jgi:predicted nucleotidyltransferase
MNHTFGLNSQTIERIHSILQNHPKVHKAMIYGSRAKGNFREGSDIDLTLCGEQLSNQDLASILDDLEESDTPYSFDLSIYDRLKDAALVEHIDRVGKVFYEVRS